MKKLLIGLFVAGIGISFAVPVDSATRPSLRIRNVRTFAIDLMHRIEKIERVLTVEGGEIGESDLRVLLGDKVGNDEVGVGSYLLGWETAQFAQATGLIAIGARTARYAISQGDLMIGNFVADNEGYVGNQNVFIAGAGSVLDAYNNVLIGNGVSQWTEEIKRAVVIGLCGGCGVNVDSILRAVLLGEDVASSPADGVTTIIDHVSVGWEATKTGNPNFGVHLGTRAGYGELRTSTLHIANNEHESLIYGEFDTRYAQINGDLRAESYMFTTNTYIYLQDGVLKLQMGSSTFDFVLTPSS